MAKYKENKDISDKVTDVSSMGYTDEQIRGLSSDFNKAYEKWEKRRGLKRTNFINDRNKNKKKKKQK